MNGSDSDQWRPMSTAPYNGTRVLVLIRATEQGSAEVDVVRWAKPDPSGEPCWMASDSDRDCVITYADVELTSWMPLPSPLPKLRTPDSTAAVNEMAGSGI